MTEYRNNDWEQNFYPLPQEPKKRKRKNKLAKKITSIVLSGMLFGGIAGGVFTGVVHMTGAASAASTQTTQEISSTPVTLQTATTTSNGSVDSQSLDVSDIVETAMPSIVAITNKSVQEVQSYFSMFGRSSGTQQQEVESQGSGIIIGQNDEELLIVTNNHVIEDAQTISACFIDDQAYEAVVKGTDADNDLAVIAVKLADISEDTMNQIKVIQVGDSDALKVGEQVVAIGNALGYGQSVTTGIVSALDRQVDGSESESGFIQTDAAINPGNSGGALLNMNGELIGINSAKLASTEIEGMGYAIPLSTASPILEDLMNRETRTQVSADQAASLGISGQTVDSAISEAYGIPEGIYIGQVQEGSAAANAGLRKGCVITKFDGTSVSTIDELKQLLTYYAAGETVQITVSIANQGAYVEQEVSVTLDLATSTANTGNGQMQQMR